MSYNSLTLIGRLGKDPVLRETTSGVHVCNFSLASSESWKDKSGQKKEKTEWTDVVVWGGQALACQKYLKKGSEVFVDGKKETRSWEKKEGGTAYKVECIAHDVKFLGGVNVDAPQSEQANNQVEDSEIPW